MSGAGRGSLLAPAPGLVVAACNNSPDNSTCTNARKAAALNYAARGLAVFPCVPRGKAPATKRGFYEATTNHAVIERWWRTQDYNVAIRTGAASGVWVLDIDGDAGRESLAALQATHGALPSTLAAVTAKGAHLWFVCDGPIPSSVARIAPGIDVRGDSASCLAPPSVHPSGHVYQWTDDADRPATAPRWLVDLARKRPHVEIERPAIRYDGAPGAYGAAALARELAALAATPRGGRNYALNRTGFRLFQLVAGGELDRASVVGGLIDACRANRLADDDGLRSIMATVRSAERGGMQHPRSRRAA